MRLLGSRRGASAIEFALTAPILFALIFGIFDVGFYFLNKGSLIMGLDEVKRTIQTGEIHDIPKAKQEAFLKKKICSSNILPSCLERIEAQVRVLSNASLSSITSDGKIDKKELIIDAGAATQIIGIEVTYRLPSAFVGPIIEEARGEDGEVYINAMTIFRTEPY